MYLHLAQVSNILYTLQTPRVVWAKITGSLGFFGNSWRKDASRRRDAASQAFQGEGYLWSLPTRHSHHPGHAQIIRYIKRCTLDLFKPTS